MRVEQQLEHEQNSANSNQMLINQLREITGIQDLQLLQSTLKASQGDISHAIGLLTAQAPAEEPVLSGPPGTDGSGQAESGQRSEPRDDLQAAIELSLQESQNAQTEERELNRALEASTEESAARVKRKRCENAGESCSPADWIRLDDWPVGIRNVGNTCWFSAVIQSLFHLPVFRRLVLSYCLSEQVLEKCKSHSDKRNIAFMQELRCLFALMVGSTRRFVDPSAAVELLRDAFRTSEAQQDVSEFTHKLLDWLEDAFQLAANGNNPEDKQENPMVQLFYGTFVAERVHEGKILSNIEQFGQYPLQVNGFNNLDECLEGAMVEGEIEILHSDQMVSSGQERWFSKLPPVLTFELSRFEFNQSLGRPEKIHKKLEFPQIIYMDRYLHKNVEQTHGRRGEVKRLKEQLTLLQQKLESYKNYGSGPVKYPLADMLQYVLEFATTKPTSVSPTCTTVTNQSTPSDPNSDENSQSDLGDMAPSDSTGSSISTAQRTPIHKPFTQCRPPIETPIHPAPHSITEEELRFVKGCLQRWRMEVENNINGTQPQSLAQLIKMELKAGIERVSQDLESMYLDSSLCQVPYRLHAVLVHEGQASAGHYWAYIYDHTHRRWLKYNDVMVTESSWEELVRDSYGGMTNASAYCLMYINDKLPHLISDTDDETGQVLQGMDSLPPILRRYVREDNRWFQQELREWEEQFCQRPPEEPQVSNTTSMAFTESTDQAEPNLPEEPAQDPVKEPNTQENTEDHTAIKSLEQHGTEETEEQVPQQADSGPLQPNPAATSEGKKDQAISITQDPGQGNSDREGVSSQVLEDEVKLEDEAKANEAQADSTAESENATSHNAPGEAAETEPEDVVSEVEIPNVGKILVRSDADGYNEEMMLTPAMQGVIMAIAKSRQVFDKDGPEAGLIKAFHEEYSRLFELSQEEATPQQDPRLQHILVYFFQNKAPNRVIERTLLEQFGDRNLSFDDRSISIMREARGKLRLIKPEDMDMEEYLQWHEDYSMFRTVFAYLLTGLEQYQNGKIRESLNYLAHAYQDNESLLSGGEKKGVEQSLIALYRRKCLKELEESAATLFRSAEESGVAEGVSIMNDSVIPCMHLIVRDSMSQEDLDMIEAIRNRWCSYLGQDMDEYQQEKLGEFLPRVLDCSSENVVLKEPPKVQSKSPHDLCSRLAAVMESLHSSSVVIVK
ncbi:ubiquitin carboxyl-terminal hydrolase 28 isoform X2 [Denticeps clupeoides]|uniref:ubiquitin carboxyl-terminal hydrolase 28 isoform X2 n=1 Tax=Denticeps clupeoides TaxID=299321 RepID=UPI0010A552DB|nr:ubiquitin carboxyl-terminal hydrolase 28 isoform X2 [Denticeps clupeoides]